MLSKMYSHVARVLIALLLLTPALGLAQQGSAFSWADFDGRQNSFVSPLVSQQYIGMWAYRLPDAKVVWVNRGYFKELGIEIPEGPLSEEIKNKILDAFAYGIPSPDDLKNSFSSLKVKVYADRYGGIGRGYNEGSGRAASFFGKIPVQSKGLGRTPLTQETGDDHSNGKADLNEAIREAIWGELNNKNLPFGANRVIAIIDRGTVSSYAKGKVHRDALIIREDPIRPAHFMNLEYRSQESPPWLLDPEIVAQVRKSFLAAVPLTEREKQLPQEQQIKDGLANYVRRIAAQYATAFAGLNYYHGATSPSNIELSGKFLDYGTQTSQPGHGKIQILKHIEEAGQTKEFKRSLITDFLNELEARLQIEPLDVRFYQKLFDQEYKSVAEVEYLKLTGLPEFVIDQILPQPLGGKALAPLIQYFATKGATRYSGKYVTNENVTRYDMTVVMQLLANNAQTSPPSLFEKLRRVLNDPEDIGKVQDFARLYLKVISSAQKIALTSSIDTNAFFTYLKFSCENRNEQNPELYRWRMFEELKSIDETDSSQNENIQDFIDSKVLNNQKNLKDESPWKTIYRASDGKKYVYDASKNSYASLKPLAAESGKPVLQMQSANDRNALMCKELFAL